MTEAQVNRLFLNMRGGFVQVTSGPAVAPWDYAVVTVKINGTSTKINGEDPNPAKDKGKCSYGAVAADFNQDGWIDLYHSNEGASGHAYCNLIVGPRLVLLRVKANKRLKGCPPPPSFPLRRIPFLIPFPLLLGPGGQGAARWRCGGRTRRRE